MIGRLKFRILIHLLKWYAGDMDQWDRMEIPRKEGNGNFYVEISLMPDGYSYRRIE